jgi:hypothetical protein
MITPTVPSYYVIRAQGEAAELITSVFSPRIMSDIQDVLVISKDFDNDIEPINHLDETIQTLKDGLIADDIKEEVEFNPMYLPSQDDQLLDALETEGKSDAVKFTAMGGNPFAVKLIHLDDQNDERLVTGIVSYQQFDLPAYEVIVNSSKNLLN